MIGSGSQVLSFYGHANGKILTHWLPFAGPETDLTWSEENQVGRRRAEELFDQCPAEDLAMLLPRIVESMGEIGGIEIGFLTRVGEYAALGQARPHCQMAA